jgi:hypothetical protein
VRGFRDGKPVVTCDVCHKPITRLSGRRILSPSGPFMALRKDGIELDVHNKNACKKKVDSVKISKYPEPEKPEDVEA